MQTAAGSHRYDCIALAPSIRYHRVARADYKAAIVGRNRSPIRFPKKHHKRMSPPSLSQQFHLRRFVYEPFGHPPPINANERRQPGRCQSGSRLPSSALALIVRHRQRGERFLSAFVSQVVFDTL
jgi:hypothetical protein